MLWALALVGGCACLFEVAGPTFGEFVVATNVGPGRQVSPEVYLGGTVRVEPGSLEVEFEHEGQVITLVYAPISQCEGEARRKELREYWASLDTARDTADTGFDPQYWVCTTADLSATCCDAELPETAR